MPDDLLVPCPFCRATDGFDLQFGTRDREGTPINVVCSGCGACGPWVYSDGDTRPAYDAWNRRAAAPAARPPEPDARAGESNDT